MSPAYAERMMLASCYAMITNQCDLSYFGSQAEKNRELSLVRAEEEDKIATALARRTLEKERKDKEIQQLREQSSELRE
jgi:hypothetical protein